jgi:hypothetical protein
VLNFLNEASGQEPRQLLAHGPTLLMVEASQTLLDRPRTGFDVEDVLGNIPGDTCYFCRAPSKHVPIALEEVDELAFLFGIQTGPDLHGFV